MITNQIPLNIELRLRQLDVLDQVTQISLSSNNMQDFLHGVLDITLEIFNADRAWFFYPCDPQASSFGVPMERTRPEWPGLFAQGADLPMDKDVSATLGAALRHPGAMQLGQGTAHPIPAIVAEMFSIKTQLMIVLRPKIGKPWLFGLHHCTSVVIHDEAEQQLFTAMALRISDALNALITVQQLRDSEEYSNKLADSFIDQAGVLVLVLDKAGRIVRFNQACEQLSGYRATEVDGKHPWDMLLPPEDADSIRQHAFEALANNPGVERANHTNYWLSRHGERFLIEWNNATLIDANGEMEYMVSIGIDITERKANEEKLDRMVKLHAALSLCNQNIVRCASEEELFQHVCRDAVRLGGLKMAWIGLVDPQSRMIKPIACYGSGTEYLEGIQISADADQPSGRGPIGRVIRENKPYWCQDYLNEPSLALWHERGKRSGWAASAALPLLRNDVVVGTLTLYSEIVNAFDEAARNLLLGMATDISYALTRFALLAEKQHAEEEIRIAATTFETQEGIMITDPDAKILRVNHAFQKITGYSASEVIGQTPRILQSGRHDAAFYQSLWTVLLDSGQWIGEIWDKRKNGEISPKLMTITAVHDDKQQVSHYVSVFRDISDSKKTEEEIHQLAFFDPLTKLPNRRLLLDRLQQAEATNMRDGRYGAMLFLDLDHFKTINDTQGHAMGDRLLVEVARRLQTCVREGDSVSRLGGDEFVVVLEGLSNDINEAANKTEMVAEKIRSELGQPYILNEYECRSTVSIGINLFLGQNESVEELLKHADVAMYQAKSSGRNVIRFFDPAMQLAVEARAALEADLRNAVPFKQMQLHYQVQMDGDLRAIGAEALIRWNHPTRGMVPPMQFIPIAEESTLILDIGNWVMDTACRQLGLWSKDEKTRNLIIAINVSAQQFKQPDFVEKVGQVLRTHQIDAALLKLELTESVVLEDVKDVVAKMHALKALGVGLSMDDFGTGYSSLAYLKQLPLDQIKIDQSFVRDMISDPNDAVMVRTIIDMANNFRLNVIAEGVETEEQMNFLKHLGCLNYQGYYFSKPVPTEQFEMLLKQ